MIYSVETEKYQRNYRLKFIMDNPHEAVLEASGNTILLKLPFNIWFTPPAAMKLRRQDSPCGYHSVSRSKKEIVIVFNCSKSTKVYPETIANNILDLIISE